MLENTDYYILCVLEITPKYNCCEPFNIKELSHYCDLDKSRVSTSLRRLYEYGFVKIISDNPILYSFNDEKLKNGKNKTKL
jgi:DNA-binding MarR family transcriptional regulator